MSHAIARPWRGLGFGLAFAILASAPAVADPLGANLQQLIQAMEESHPALSAAAASRTAASAQVEIAGALEDPQFTASFEDLDRDEGLLPQRLGSIFYSIEQKFPLGGKRALRRQVAEAGVAEAATERDEVRLGLIAQMRVAYAQHHLAILAARTVAEEGEALQDLAALARERYAQGLGAQQDAIEAEAELAGLAVALADAERDRLIAVGRINLLIGRAPDATLAPPAALPAIPKMDVIQVGDLIARAGARSPTIAARNAVMLGAAASAELADRNWYPDLTVGVSVVDRDRDITGYEAMIGVNIPLQWGLRRAEQGQARAKLAEARGRASAARIALALQVQGTTENLRAAVVREAVIRADQLPRLKEALAASVRAYAADQGDLAQAIAAARRLKQMEREHIQALMEQQLLAAELDQLTGESL